MCPQPSSRQAASDRAVSPVIGVTLLVAIVVVLATVVAGMALGFGDELHSPAPQGGFTVDYYADGAGNGGKPYFELTYESGPTSDASDIIVRDEAGNEVTWADVWTAGPEVEAGEYIHIDGDGSDGALEHVCELGQRFTVVVRRDDGGALPMMTYEIPRPPSEPTGWC
jgi:flagellin-like protein